MLLEMIIGCVVALFLGATIYMEIKNRNKKTDLFTNIVIAVIGLGSSIYMLYSISDSVKKNNQGVFDINLYFSEITTWVYILVALLAAAFTVVFLYFYFKNKDLPDEKSEEESEESEPVLSDEEIEEILEQENKEENEEEQSEEVMENDEIDDHIVLESLTAQKPKVLKPDEEEFKFKEGATQVPENQRNPFEKK